MKKKTIYYNRKKKTIYNVGNCKHAVLFTENMSKMKEEVEQSGENGLQTTAQSILSKREKIIENFLRELSSCSDLDFLAATTTTTTTTTNALTTNNNSNSNSNDGGLDECDEQQFLQDMEKKLADVSILLSNKYGPILKQFLSQRQQQIFSDLYLRIPKVIQCSLSTLNLSVVYNKCFLNWIDSPCVSVNSPNKVLLKHILPKDLYLLTFYSMACIKRVKFDECFTLAVVGKSSCGKSRLFESVLQEAAFTFNNEKGVGRYSGCKHRPILMYHDIDITVLYKGTDGAIFRSLARTEPTNVKIHSGLITLPPLWIFISSNQRINSHSFERNDTFSSANFAPVHSFFTSEEKYESQLKVAISKQEQWQESLTAVRMRVLELFVKAAPDLENTPLPNGILFTRQNLIVGLYNKIVQTMKKYCLNDFHSPLLVSYVLTALCSNYKIYKKNWPDSDLEKLTEHDVTCLIVSFVSDVSHQALYFQMLDN